MVYTRFKNYHEEYMSSRFSLYQNSIKKFIANQSIISKHMHKEFILKIIESSEYILPISLLTIMNGQQKKNNLKTVHGYEIASGVELLTIMLNIIETKKLNNTYNNVVLNNPISDYICQDIVSLVYQTLNNNISNLSTYYTIDNVNKIHKIAMDHLHEKITKMNSTVATLELPQNLKLLQKTDLRNFHFKNFANLETLNSVKQLPKDFLIQYISGTYGSICKLSLILGWIMGGSPVEQMASLDKIGNHFGMMLKLAYDFINIESDLEHMINGISFNYVINFGIQNTFELFDESKKKFIEGLMTLDITTPTLKEFIDILQTKVDNTLDASSPDIRSSSSSFIN